MYMKSNWFYTAVELLTIAVTSVVSTAVEAREGPIVVFTTQPWGPSGLPTTTVLPMTTPVQVTHPAPSCWTTTITTDAPWPTGGVPTWGQCGGVGYTGAVSCGTGATCVYYNEYYSQCQPAPVTQTLTVCT